MPESRNGRGIRLPFFVLNLPGKAIAQIFVGFSGPLSASGDGRFERRSLRWTPLSSLSPGLPDGKISLDRASVEGVVAQSKQRKGPNLTA